MKVNHPRVGLNRGLFVAGSPTFSVESQATPVGSYCREQDTKESCLPNKAWGGQVFW